MANICEYRVKVKGRKNACYAFLGSMPHMDYRNVNSEVGSDMEYEMIISGNCKWSVDAYCKKWDGDFPADLPADSNEAYEEAGKRYCYVTVKERSELFNTEVWCNSCDIDGDPDTAVYVHYKNGEPIDDNLPEELVIEGTTEVQSAAEQAESDIDLEDLSDKLDQLLRDVESLAAESGIDLNPSNIGDTGYDMYNWTFTEGKRKKGDGWSVAIPDGFSTIDSDGGRLFEAVPQGMENDEDVPVRILPGEKQELEAMKDRWMYHPYARAGAAETVAVKMARVMAQFMGKAPEVLSVGFSDICAYVLLVDTSSGSYSYQCQEMTDSRMQMLRVQTQYITDEQKKTLTKSVISWLQTFKFDEPNSCVPKKAQIEYAKVINDLKKGKTNSFEAAIDRACLEYSETLNGRLGTMHYLAEYGMLDEEAPGTVKEILLQAMEVKEFYYIKTDQVVEKLKEAQIETDVMQKVYKKLKDMENILTEFSVDDEAVTVEIPAEVKKIQKKWKSEASNLKKHKKYLNAKSEQAAADTYEKMKKAEENFRSLKGYLDSAESAEACALAAAELKEKEEEQKRVKKAQEEAKKREEAEKREQKRKAEADRIAAEKKKAEMRKEAERLEQERRAEADRIAAEKAKARKAKMLKIAIPAVCVCIAFFVVLITVIIPNVKYNSAIAMIEEEEYFKAYEVLSTLNGYKDSESKMQEIYKEYRYGQLSYAEIGDTVVFGSYEQDNSLDNGKEDIEWLVLEKQPDKVLVISKYGLDCKPYNDENVDIIWKNCTLRKWLNEDFFKTAFDNSQQSKIAETRSNPVTIDRVFLLSTDEAEEYFLSSDERLCEPTEYAVAQDVNLDDMNGCSWWWLRSPGDYEGAAGVGNYGGVDLHGTRVNSDIGAVRPALWINLQ